MHLGKNNGKHNYTMGLSQIQPLTKVNEEKDLGVLFYCSMKFSKHCARFAAKANSMVGLIK